MHGDVLDQEDEAADSCAESLDVDDVEDEDDVEEEEDDEGELDSLLLDEDSDAPNLVPEVEPRGILAGRIEILEKIGQGGMGAVWRGHHLKLDRPVAVKILDETLQLRPDGRERFIREARALALLDHRNVVRVYDCDQLADGTLFLCMELLDGETLRDVVKRGSRLDPLEVIDVGLQVCDATQAAHERGILHRDLTPSNIIRLRDPTRTIKVIDWGLCKYLDLFYVRSPPRYGDPPGSRLVTPFGCRFGTPEYMAPELMRRESPGTPSFCTDVYALGVVLYELLTGRHPFARGDRRKPLPVRGSLPGFEYQDLETALRAALRFDPDERTQTMAELREALDLARECLLAQREPPAVSVDDQVAPIVPPPGLLPAAPGQPVAPLAGVAAGTCEALPGPMPTAPGQQAASLAGAAADACEALPDPRTSPPTRPRGRLAVAALSLLLGVGMGVGGTLAAQHLGGSSEPPAGAPSPVLAANLAQEADRASAAEPRAERCEAEAANQPQAPESDSPSPAPPSRSTSTTSSGTGTRPVVLAAMDSGPMRPQARPARSIPAAQTFQEAMARLEPRLRGCARKAGVPELPTTVQIRRQGAVIDTVKVLNWSKEHPFSICVDQLVRKTTFPPGARPIEEVTFFK